MSATSRPRVGAILTELMVCLVIGAIASVLVGQDANWDLRNYHLYNPYAWLNGRVGLDLLPAGTQSTFNPLLNLPYYVLAMGPLADAPRVMAAVAGLPFGALLFATLRLARWMLGDPAGAERLLPWLVVAIAGSAAATASEIGTTFNDIPIAALLLGGFVLAGRRSGVRPSLAAHLGAGAMLGAAVALKPVAAVFIPGLVLGLAVLALGARGRLRVVACIGAGGLAAAAVLAGPWALMLLRLYGNPVFPLMNGLFRSPWYPPIDAMDPRFLPRTPGQVLFYPFYWISRNAMMVTEPPFRDARLAIGMVAIPLLALAAWRGRLIERRRVLAVLIVAVLGYVFWLQAFSILRYALVLEALAALLIVAAVRTLARWAAPGRVMLAPGLSALLLCGLIWRTEPPDWWRIPFGARVFDVEVEHLPPGSLVLTINAPVAMALPFLDAPGYRAIGLTRDTLKSQGYRLFAEIERGIWTHEGPIFALSDETARVVEVAPRFGLTVDATKCHQVRNNIVFNGLIMFCPLGKP